MRSQRERFGVIKPMRRFRVCSCWKHLLILMKTKTSPYRRQLAQLARLAAAVPTSAPIKDPSTAIAALLRVRSVLVVHLLLEKGLLYPWLLQRATRPVCENVCRHRDAMSDVLAAFLGFCSEWSTEAAIAADPQEFVRAWAFCARLSSRT